MSFKISIDEDLSIADLVDIYKNGGVVLKTPHVGNIYPNNLAIGSLGIPMLFYDRTLGAKDFNFHPDRIIVKGDSMLVADSDILTTHSIIRQVPQSLCGSIKIGSKVLDLHMLTLKHAIPQANCFTYTEYLQNNKDQILKVLEKVTELYPSLWWRVVSEDGIVSKSQANNWDDILNFGIFGLTNVRKGWIIPNLVNVLFHGTVDISKAGRGDVYLLSGPDMYKYIDGYQCELNRIYDQLKMSIDLSLPETVNCHIVPVANMRFIVEVDFKESLDELVDLYIKYRTINSSIAKSGASVGSSTADSIKEKYKIKDEIFNCIARSFESFKMTMFYNIEEANCFTQYDLINSRGLYIHPWAINNSLLEVSKAYSFLQGCYLCVRDRLQE